MKRLLSLIACWIGLTGLSAQAASDVLLGNAAAGRVSMSQVDHSDWDRLLQKYVDEDGFVDYKGWHSNAVDQKQLDDYLRRLSKATRKPDSSTQAGHRLAFWINAYNAVTIKGILREYPTSSIRNHTAKFFGYNIWKNLKLYVGGTPYSLDQMEHEILRKMNEPRIHFAIVCASIGCPRLLNRAYVMDQLDDQLNSNAKDFFSRRQNFKHDIAQKRFQMSSLLNWFGEDFGSNQKKILQRISKWLPTEAAKKAAASNAVSVTYLDYNWNLNSQ